MLNKNLNLSSKIFSDNIDKTPTRDGYGEGLVEAGRQDGQVVVLSADLTESTRAEYFKKEFPERFIEVGVAEQNLATLASGMANYGKIPFISSYAMFSPGRNWEQIRTTIALNNVPVKIAGAHTGVSVGPDGATHQALEDIALMRVLPNMVVLVPCDAVEAKKAVIAAALNGKPTYIRFTKTETPEMTTEDSPFEVGKADIFWDSVDENKQQTTKNKVAIIGCGPLVYEALLAAKKLDEEAIRTIVVNNHTIKPIDEETIIEVARKCGAVVTVEEHQIAGGMGSAVAEVLSKNYPVPMEFVGMSDSFGESGDPDELLEKYKMKSVNIIQACRKVITHNNS
jgi:transketolase